MTSQQPGNIDPEDFAEDLMVRKYAPGMTTWNPYMKKYGITYDGLTALATGVSSDAVHQEAVEDPVNMSLILKKGPLHHFIMAYVQAAFENRMVNNMDLDLQEDALNSALVSKLTPGGSAQGAQFIRDLKKDLDADIAAAQGRSLP